MDLRIRRAFTVAALLCLITAACQASQPTGGRSPVPASLVPDAQTPAAQGARGGRVVDSALSDARRLNPAISDDTTSPRITSKIYDALISVDARTGEVKPWLGSWTVSSDSLRYSWTIDGRASWSDGIPITGRDWLARVKMQARSKVTPSKSIYNDVEGYQDYATGKATSISGISVDRIDPKKFTVRLTRAFCPALANVFGTAPMPEHVFGRYTVDDDPDRVVDGAPENDAPPVASGPFKFKEWRRGDQVVLTRNERYFKGAPLIEEYVLKVVADQAELAAQLRSGELSMGLVQPGDVAELSAEPRLKLHRWPDNGYVFIGWRTNGPNVTFLADKRVRQALMYGLDTLAVIRSALFGEGTKRVSHQPSASWASAPASELNRYDYDMARAESLLEQAGFARGADGFFAKDGKPLAITIVTNQENTDRGTFLRIATDQYRQIGIRIDPKTERFESLVPKLTGGSPEVEAAIIGLRLGVDPDPFTILHSSNVASPTRAGSNFVGYSDPEVDKLIEQGRSGPDCSQAARQAVYRQMEKILNEDVPFNFGFAQNRILAADARLQGIKTGTFSPNADSDAHLWWIKP